MSSSSDPPFIKFYCLHCGQKLSIEAGVKVRTINCPVCSELTPLPMQALAGIASPARLELPAPVPGETGTAERAVQESGAVRGPTPPPAGTTSLQELIESLHDVGFEVDPLSVFRGRSSDPQVPE